MNLINTLKSAAAISTIALSFVSAPSFATTAASPLSLATCTVKNNCDLPDPNGPRLDGFAGTVSKALSLRQCPSKGNCEIPDQNGPSLDGFAVLEPAGAKPGVCYNDMSGLGLDGIAVPAGVIQNGCHDMNGPSLNGFSDSKLGTAVSTIDE